METKLKILEFVQSVILRMSNNSFLLKGWTVTLIVGMFALASIDTDKHYFVIAYIPTIVFWFLDSYYLQLERKFRVLYNKKSEQSQSELSFDIVLPASSRNDKTCFWQSLFSPSEIGFYVPLIALVLLVSICSSAM